MFRIFKSLIVLGLFLSAVSLVGCDGGSTEGASKAKVNVKFKKAE